MHRLKGFTYGIDEDAYADAYSVERLRWLRDAAGADFVFLSYNWGLPPEVEAVDWAAFEDAARAAHDLGMGVAAYVQPSNAVALGSYADRDWYAATPKGRRIPYYAGRYFTCLNSPEWRETVFARVSDALTRGADAIFLDNCAFGGMPVPLSTDYTAFAGCFCSRCQSSFRAWQTARGADPTGIPRLFRPGRDPIAREFSHWRAWCLTGFLREIRDRMRRQSPGAALLTNTVGAVNLNTYNIFGVDLPELAHIVDWMFVENLQSPRAGDGLLVQNAGTFKLLRALKPGAPALSISYDRGIGVDGVPAPAVFERTMAEAYAAGGIPVIRAGEYIEEGDWTLLQPGRHDTHAAAAREIVRFSAESFGPARVSAAGVAVFVPPGLAWRGDLYPAEGSDFQSVIQALVGSAIPFTVVVSEADLGPDVRVLLVPAGVPAPAAFAGVVVRYDELGIRKRRRSLIDYGSRPLEPLLRRVGPWAVDGYFSRVHVRRFADRLNLVFRLVFREQFTAMELTARSAAKLRAANPCAVFAPTPVFADLWRTGTTLQLHLVNYSEKPVSVDVVSHLREPARVRTPGEGNMVESRGPVMIETYAILEWDLSRAATLARDGEAAPAEVVA